MQGLAGWFKGSAPDNEPPSLLAEWNSYSGKSGAANTGAESGNLLASAEEGASTVGRIFTTAFSSVTSAATSMSSGVQNVPGTTQLVYFAVLAGSGLVFMLLAVFVFLPVIILVPSKFAMTFSMGSALLLASLGALKGWQQMFGHMASKERLPFTAAYVAALASTMYASLVMQSYLLSLGCCMAQVVTAVLYVASFFPGGATGAQYVFLSMGRGAFNVSAALLRGMFNR